MGFSLYIFPCKEDLEYLKASFHEKHYVDKGVNFINWVEFNFIFIISNVKLSYFSVKYNQMLKNSGGFSTFFPILYVTWQIYMQNTKAKKLMAISDAQFWSILDNSILIHIIF